MKRINLKVARIRKRINQKELAEKLGVTPQAISDMERGKYNPSYETMKKISEILETSVDELFFSNESEVK